MRETDSFGVFVVAREGENITSLLKRFKRKVTKAEVLKEFREHTEFLKPGVKKRKKQKEARSRAEKELLKMEKDNVKKGYKKHNVTKIKKENNNENIASDQR